MENRLDTHASHSAGSRIDEDVGTALTRVIVAGQRMLADRVDLALHEGRTTLRQAAVSVTLVTLGGLVLLGGLVAIDVALVDLFRSSSSNTSILLVCAAMHGLLGAGLVYAGLRRKVHSS